MFSEIIDSALRFPSIIWMVPALVTAALWLLTLIGVVGDSLDADIDIDLDLDADADAPGITAGMLDALAIGTVPLTLVATILSWTGSFLSVAVDVLFGDWGVPLLGSAGFSITVLLATFLIAIYATTWFVRPLKPLFRLYTQHGQQHLVGKLVTVSSSRVTERFGIATCPAADGSGDLILNVIYAGDHVFEQGEEAVITAFDSSTTTYTVAPFQTADALDEGERLLSDAAEADRRSASRFNSHDLRQPRARGEAEH